MPKKEIKQEKVEIVSPEPLKNKIYRFSFQEKTESDYINSILEIEASAMSDAIAIFNSKKKPIKGFIVREIK